MPPKQEDLKDWVVSLAQHLGVDAVINAVGVDAEPPECGLAAATAEEQAMFAYDIPSVAPDTNTQGDPWVPQHSPSQAEQRAVRSVSDCGRLGIMGECSPNMGALQSARRDG